jgi:hypothetical protein
LRRRIATKPKPQAPSDQTIIEAGSGAAVNVVVTVVWIESPELMMIRETFSNVKEDPEGGIGPGTVVGEEVALALGPLIARLDALRFKPDGS